MKTTIVTMILAMLIAPIGMQAKKKDKKVEVPQLQNYPSAELSEFRLHGGNVVVQGHFVVHVDKQGKVRENVTVEQLLNE